MCFVSWCVVVRGKKCHLFVLCQRGTLSPVIKIATILFLNDCQIAQAHRKEIHSLY